MYRGTGCPPIDHQHTSPPILGKTLQKLATGAVSASLKPALSRFAAASFTAMVGI